MFEDANKFIKRIFVLSIISVILWSIEYAEFKFRNQEGKTLPLFLMIPILLMVLVISFTAILINREDYGIMSLKEIVQIQRLCLFLDGYGELGREEIIKWIMKITKSYYVLCRNLVLCLATGREPDWDNVRNPVKNVKYLKSTAQEVINDTARRKIFEHVRRVDELGNTGAESILKSQLYYIDNVCYGRMDELAKKRIFICRTISYVPVFCTVIFYMIYPFVSEGINLLSSYSEEMELLNKL